MTNQRCLQQPWSRVYKQVLQQLSNYEATQLDEKKWIEWGFGITLKAWFNIQQETDNYVFDDPQEEIAFFKVVQPRFIALIDYFTLLYKSALFQPEDPVATLDYWQHELDTCKHFLLKHHTFCRYYEQGNTTLDAVYFVQKTNQQSLVFGVNGRKITSYSYLLARVLSVKKYQRYVLKKLLID